MKKIMLGLVAAFAFASFAAPVRAQEAGGDAAKADSGAKKKSSKKAKKGEKTEAGGEAAGGEAAPKK